MEEKHIGEDISKNKTNNVKGRNVNNLGFVNLLLLLPLLFDYLQFCQSQIYLKILKVLSLRTYKLNENASLNCHKTATVIIVTKSIQYIGNAFSSSNTVMASKHFLGESVP